MKKSSFITLILGTVSGIFFSLGMCMALLLEWNAFTEGVVFGTVGLIMAIVTLLVWCKMEHKALPKLNAKLCFQIAFGVVGTLILRLGMCLCLVWSKIVWGTLVGMLGIVMLICLIPMIKGIK